MMFRPSFISSLVAIMFVYRSASLVTNSHSTFFLNRFKIAASAVSSATTTSSGPASAEYRDSKQHEITFTASAGLDFAGDVLILPFYKPKNDTDLKVVFKNHVDMTKVPSLHTLVHTLLEEFSKEELDSSKVVRLYMKNDEIKFKSIAFLSLGKLPDKDNSEENKEMNYDEAKKLSKTLVSLLKDSGAKSAGIILPSSVQRTSLTQTILGILDNYYIDNRYKKAPEKGFPDQVLKSIQFLGSSAEVHSEMNQIVNNAHSIASGVQLAKDLVGAPPNSKTPLVITDVASQVAKDFGLDITVLGEEECNKLDMGAYLGVQQGSKFPPRFLHLTYRPKGEVKKKIACIGKGLTFDSGGYNLKAGPGSMIEMMKFDMGGCAAVLGAAKAIAQLQPNHVEVHFITAVCENMISADAVRPGDIIIASNGKSIEVLNTDAEGRLTLADALVYAEKLGVDTIVDLATLTGACITALGDNVAAVYSSKPHLEQQLMSASKSSGDKLWPFPLEESYREAIKSSIADLKNISGMKGGGSITAALFLQEFVNKPAWAHIDMAGPVWDGKGNKPTGYGVKLLVDFIMAESK